MMIGRRQRRNIESNVRCTLYALIFCQSLNRLQRGLSAIAELLVPFMRAIIAYLFKSRSRDLGVASDLGLAPF